MVDPTDIGERIETRKDLGTGDPALYAYWMAQEAIVEREERKWLKQGREIVKRYRDERPESIQNTHRFNILWSNVQTLIPTLYGRTPKPDVERRFKDNDPVARLSATLLERCLAFSADNDVTDFDDVMEAVVQDRLLPGRGVARVMYIPHFGEPIEEQPLDEPEADEFDDKETGAAIVTNPGDDLDDKNESETKPEQKVVYEEAVLDYVFWEDYREGPARKRSEVPWERYRSYLTREQLIERFGPRKGNEVELDYTPKGAPAESAKEEPPADLYKKACVHEVWDKTKREVVWYAPGTPDVILDKRPDPLRLPDFFPSVPPLRSTATNDKLVPVADYIEYQDQARELDSLTARIDKLTRALKIAGVYAGEEKQVLQQLIDEGTENRLIPVGDLAAFTDRGGLKGLIEYLPIQQIAETLIQLHNARDRVKALLYELTGIGDIMRGMTVPDETAAAQKLKANFSTRRVSPQQRKVAKFARNAFRLIAAVVAEHFSPQTISLVTGYPQLDPVPPLPPRPQMPMQQPMLPAPQGVSPAPADFVPPQGQNLAAAGPPAQPQQPSLQMQAYQAQMAQWQQMQAAQAKIVAANQQKQQEFDAAVALIKRDGIHGFRIDIEADSTVAIDEAEDQENRVEFMRQFIPMLQQVVPIAQGNPPLAALAKEMTLFAMRGFRVARPLEESVSSAFDAIAKMAPQQSGQQGGEDSPADLAVRTKQIDSTNAKTQAQLQIARERNAVEMAKLGQESHDSAAELAAKETADRMKHGLDIARQQDESALRRERIQSLQAREASRLM